jgi:ABC-type maltose transport system permease subunit
VNYLDITYPEVALTGLLLVLPIAIVFILFQRVLVQGILSGSAKG